MFVDDSLSLEDRLKIMDEAEKKFDEKMARLRSRMSEKDPSFHPPSQKISSDSSSSDDGDDETRKHVSRKGTKEQT